ncbi:MAG TPA: DNA polymerase III subunit alpha [Bacteroidales bacterium]|nr:DNA polymerase III subunit alpha [Bacteroidales bacterium]
MYINCHSYYSLRYGTIPIERLSELAAAAGITRMVLTDINNTTGVPDFVRECGSRGITPAAGIEFRRDNTLLYIGIARNNEGFRELNEFLTHHNFTGEPLPLRPPSFPNAYVIYPSGVGGSAGRVNGADSVNGASSAGSDDLTTMRDNEFIGIRPSAAGRLISMTKKQLSKCVILQPVTMESPSDYPIHRSLRAIDNNLLLSRLEPHHTASPDEIMLPENEIIRPFEMWPQVTENTRRLLNDCSLQIDFTTPKNKKIYSASRYDDKLLLEKLALDGMKYRYGTKNKVAEERVRHELEIIDNLGFSSYFLITWDIIRYSMACGFYHVGRGSGANSVVAYCLKITNVDPIDLNLYFERFINPKRTSPPDFDIDYSWKERDTVTEYIFRRYGHRHTALLGTIGTFRGRSIVRELGKVHGLPVEEIDALITDPSSVSNRGEIQDMIFETGNRIADYPNLRSIHAGGVLISEEPVCCYTALDMPPKGFPTTQWDMYTAEELGYEKLDILSQRGIGHIAESAEIIKMNQGVDVDVHAVQKFKNDPLVKDHLRRGDAKGCFYIESPSMRGLLQKLRCDDYLTLIAASSVIRPGVARSGMMRQFIYRFHNPDKFEYIHPVMKDLLSETFGVMVYQEDVLKVCHHFAGLDLSDADTLRRAMSGKHRSKQEMQKITGRFFDNCRDKGYPEDITKEVWRQIESFAGYSFSKAHSASYAVESFQSLWLKSHYPLEFMVAVINNFGGFYRTWVYVHEAKRQGALVESPCINRSTYKTSIRKSTLYIGFIHLSGLQNSMAHEIIRERDDNGEYQDLSDFISRIGPGLEQCILLIRSGAFRFTGKSKALLLWEAHMQINKGKSESARTLFNPEPKKFVMPPFEQSRLEDAYDEIELLGFPVSMTWFDMLQTKFRGEITAAEMKGLTGRKVKMVGHLVTVKYIKTIKKEWMNFGCFIDSTGEFFDTTHFPQTLNSWPFRGSGTYLIQGKIVDEFGYTSVEVEKMARLPIQPDPRY